jgi:hypothetical protein
MENSSATILKIKKNLKKIPASKLDEVNDYLEFILSKFQIKSSKNIIKFEGIWQGLGFEKIDNLEAEIRKLRDESTIKIADRVKRWNI